MRDWGANQGMQIIELVDGERNGVTVSHIREAVNKMLESDTMTQLWIYFAGHGLNIAYDDYWLLSDAANESGESVDLDKSVKRAEHCRLEHVIFVGDTCRLLTQNMRFQGITGTPIFPNFATANATTKVDEYFSSKIGQPSLEVLADDGKYTAAYTELLCEVLSGKHPHLHEKDKVLETEVVRPWPVNDFLSENVPKRLEERAVPANLFQTPDSRIRSRPEAWLSDVSKYPSPQQNVKSIEELNEKGET